MSAGAAGAGAAIGSLAGPGGAAIGAVGGIVAVELMEEEAPTEVVGTGPAATIHETTSLVQSIGLWYLLIFVLLPFVSKRGRTWVSGFLNSAPKKWVSENWERLNTIEETIKSPQTPKRK